MLAAVPNRPPPEVDNCTTSGLESTRVIHPNGASSAIRRVRENRIWRTVARHAAQCRRCGRIETICTVVALPTESASSVSS